MPEQQTFAFPKPKRARPSPLDAQQRIREQQLEQARRIAAEPEAHCEGLRRWSELVLASESEVTP